MKLLMFVEQTYSFGVLDPIASEARARGCDLAWYVLPGVDARPADRGPVFRALKEARAFRADAVLVPGNWVPSGLARKAVQIFHGLAFEKKGHFRVRGFFDLYCTPGPRATALYEGEARRLGYFTVAETGWPKFDPFSDAARAPHAPHRPLRVLYAPTFSERLTSLPALLGEWTRLAREEGFEVRVKMHPLVAPALMAAYREALPKGAVLPESANVMEQIGWADIVVSDTSSTIREANWFGRPVVTFRTVDPGPHVLDFDRPEGLEPAIRQAVAQYEALRGQGLDSLRDVHPFRDGESSRRVLGAIEALLAAPAPPRRKPINLLRRAKVWWRMSNIEKKAVPK